MHLKNELLNGTRSLPELYPEMPLRKTPFLTVGDFSYNRRKKLSRALRRNPARSACTLKRPKGVVWDMPVNDSRASENAPDFSKNGNIFCLSVSRMEWRIYAA